MAEHIVNLQAVVMLVYALLCWADLFDHGLLTLFGRTLCINIHNIHWYCTANCHFRLDWNEGCAPGRERGLGKSIQSPPVTSDCLEV